MHNYGCAAARPNRDHTLSMPATGQLLVAPDQGRTLHAQLALGATGKDSLPVQISHAHAQFAQYEEQRRQLETSQPASDFDRTVEQIKKLEAPRPTRVRKGKNPADGKELGDGE